MTNFEKVGLFMTTFGQEVKTKPGLSSTKINDLRINLINEELEEFRDAIKNNDLKEAIDALEKEFRISGKKTFLFNRNHSAAVFPYIKIRKESMDYKEGREFEKLFYKKGNYLKICSYLNRRTIVSLEEELEKFIKLIEKQETKWSFYN